MDRQLYFDDQVVGADDLGTLQDAIESAVGRVLADYLLGPGGGVLSGLVPAQFSGPSPTVQVTPGIAYDGSMPPRRISVPTLTIVDLSRDLTGAATTVGAQGSRLVTLTVRQGRTQYDMRLNADGVQVPFRSDESFVFEVFAGAVAAGGASAIPPSVPATNVILADWLLTPSAALPTDRARSFARRVPSSPLQLKLGARDAVGQLGALTQNNCLVVADSPWSMSVRVLPGRVNIASQSFTIQGGLVGPLKLPVANPKIVLVYVDPTSGQVLTADGAEAANPTPPSHVLGIALAQVLVRPGDTFLDESRISDVRPFLGMAALRGNVQASEIDLIQDANNYLDLIPTTAKLVANGATVAQLDTSQLLLAQHYVELAELATPPPAPPSGRVRLYVRTGPTVFHQPRPATQLVIRWADGRDTVIAEGDDST
jgi:hypothetical protein